MPENLYLIIIFITSSNDIQPSALLLNQLSGGLILGEPALKITGINKYFMKNSRMCIII